MLCRASPFLKKQRIGWMKLLQFDVKTIGYCASPSHCTELSIAGGLAANTISLFSIRFSYIP
jgi:hypothetical protein